MKELLTVRSNFFSSWGDDGKLIPQVELILVMSEPTYSADAAGEVVRNRELSHVRLVVTPASLVRLSAALIGLAEESDKLQEQKTK